MADHLIEVDEFGTIRYLHDDALAGLADQGKATITRVSDVEAGEDGLWRASMARVGGPVLGPFRLRGEALAAERAWLEAKGLANLDAGRIRRRRRRRLLVRAVSYGVGLLPLLSPSAPPLVAGLWMFACSLEAELACRRLLK